jgi:biotin carboxylase
MELLVNVMNEVKEVLGHPLSDDPDVFRDKYLQRQMIRDHNPELGIKYVQGAPEDLQIEELEEKVGYPFIIKPVDGVQSSGVGKINNREDFEEYISHYEVFHERLKSRGVDNKMLIVEEYIDGKMYSVDYYVDFEGNVLMSKPVKVKLGVDIGVDDYCNIARICTEKTQNEFK